MKRIRLIVELCLICAVLFFAGVGDRAIASFNFGSHQQAIVQRTKQQSHQINPNDSGEWVNRALTPKDKEEILAAHNKYRAELRLSFVTWDEGLASSAQNWAYRIRNAHSLNHSPRGGENLWGGTKGAFSYTNMVDGWGSEKQFYAGGIFPEVATQSKGWRTVGHYTQIVWRKTTKIGCGIATDDTRDFLVCHYDPVGNVVGQTVALLP